MKNIVNFITTLAICILLAAGAISSAATSVYGSSLELPQGTAGLCVTAGQSGPVGMSAAPGREGLKLTLEECLRLALAQNLDIRMAEESISRADAEIAQARSAMLPYLGAEASYVRLDEELGVAGGPVSMTFQEKDIYKAGLFLRQPIGYLRGGRGC